jgi:hypothetical protein
MANEVALSPSALAVFWLKSVPVVPWPNSIAAMTLVGELAASL